MSLPASTNLLRSDPASGDDDGLTDFDGAKDLLRQWSRGIRPDPDLTVSQWADRHRWLSSRASAEPGRYRTARTSKVPGENVDPVVPADDPPRLNGQSEGVAIANTLPSVSPPESNVAAANTAPDDSAIRADPKLQAQIERWMGAAARWDEPEIDPRVISRGVE